MAPAKTTPRAADTALRLRKPGPDAVPIHLVDRASLATTLARTDAATRRWLAASGFQGAPDTAVLVPDGDAGLGCVWAGTRAVDHPLALAFLPRTLPPGAYRLGEAGLTMRPELAALSWSRGAYAFERYKAAPRAPATLEIPPSEDARRGLLLGEAFGFACDLINTPAEDLGPAELGSAARALAQSHGASYREFVGDELLQARFPAIHAVGRASPRAPRLIQLDWGDADARRLTLVGKGVCIDTGGLNLKASDALRFVNKDKGGAAHALALAQLVMALKLPVRLQLLIPTVDNVVAGDAYRPGDIIRTRKGLTVEVGNTDAEGRVILCDALAYGAEQRPEVMIDMATLTGAARVALGTQLPALYGRDMAQARALVDLGLALHDPLWHMPLWKGYHADIESPIADLVNIGRGTFAGSVVAALFLEDFVPDTIDWLHLDLYAWNDVARPGHPVGGDVHGVRTLLAWLEQRFGPAAG